jgi:hypothetical protein
VLDEAFHEALKEKVDVVDLYNQALLLFPQNVMTHLTDLARSDLKSACNAVFN